MRIEASDRPSKLTNSESHRQLAINSSHDQAAYFEATRANKEAHPSLPEFTIASEEAAARCGSNWRCAEKVLPQTA